MSVTSSSGSSIISKDDADLGKTKLFCECPANNSFEFFSVNKNELACLASVPIKNIESNDSPLNFIKVIQRLEAKNRKNNVRFSYLLLEDNESKHGRKANPLFLQKYWGLIVWDREEKSFYSYKFSDDNCDNEEIVNIEKRFECLTKKIKDLGNLSTKDKKKSKSVGFAQNKFISLQSREKKVNGINFLVVVNLLLKRTRNSLNSKEIFADFDLAEFKEMEKITRDALIKEKLSKQEKVGEANSRSGSKNNSLQDELNNIEIIIKNMLADERNNLQETLDSQFRERIVDAINRLNEFTNKSNVSNEDVNQQKVRELFINLITGLVDQTSFIGQARQIVKSVLSSGLINLKDSELEKFSDKSKLVEYVVDKLQAIPRNKSKAKQLFRKVIRGQGSMWQNSACIGVIGCTFLLFWVIIKRYIFKTRTKIANFS